MLPLQGRTTQNAELYFFFLGLTFGNEPSQVCVFICLLVLEVLLLCLLGIKTHLSDYRYWVALLKTGYLGI